jgi:CRISPR system Cascade subunit CasB
MEEPKSTPLNVLFGKPLQAWWEKLNKEDRSGRAILRRCASLDAVAMSAPYQRFYRYMVACGWSPSASEAQRDKLAAIAGLLAHLEIADTRRLPDLMSPAGEDKPLVSELRFRALLKIETTDDLFVGLRRVMPLISHQTNLSMLARDVYWWGDGIKKEWAYSYRWPAK